MSASALRLCPRPPRLRTRDARVLAHLLASLPEQMITNEEREALERAIARAEAS